MVTGQAQGVQPGDVVAVVGRHVGDRGRKGEVVEVLGDELHPHFRVRWEDGHESVLYPGEGVTIGGARPGTAGVASNP